jgi:CRISPR-associated protein Cas5d
VGYGIKVRVKGDYALFTRPEMKVERVSYDVPTPSAVRGILESIYWKPAITWIIDKIHVLNPIQVTNIRRNEVSDKVSTSTAKSIMSGNEKPFYLDVLSSRQQRASLVLKDVDYIIEAHFEILPDKAGKDDTPEKHYNMILRRLRKGQHYHQPCLGTREFPANVELFEDGALPKSQLTGIQDLGWMLYDMDFTDPDNITPIFFRATMVEGVIDLHDVHKAG